MLKGSFNNHVDKKKGEGVSKMSTIVHVREGGGHENVHVDRIFWKNVVFLLICEVDMYLQIITRDKTLMLFSGDSKLDLP